MHSLLDQLDLLAADLLIDAEDKARALTLQLRADRGGDDGCLALLELARLIGEAGDPQPTLSAALAIVMRDDLSAALVLTIACFAAIRIDHAARQDATATRVSISTAAAKAYDLIEASGPDVMSWLVGLVGVTVRHLSADATSRVPVVRVETGISLPSSLLAWDLYGAPQRGAEIVARNGSGTPMVMSVTFEALAS